MVERIDKIRGALRQVQVCAEQCDRYLSSGEDINFQRQLLAIDQNVTIIRNFLLLNQMNADKTEQSK